MLFAHTSAEETSADAHASATDSLGHHELLDPSDRPVGEECCVIAPEQVAHDHAPIRRGDQHHRVGAIHNLGEGQIE
jgi:hypothetical protein